MTMPKTAVVLNNQFDAETAELQEWCVLMPGGFQYVPFYDFLCKYSNWGKEEIGHLTRSECLVTRDRMLQLVADRIIPLAIKPPSAAGPAENPTATSPFGTNS